MKKTAILLFLLIGTFGISASERDVVYIDNFTYAEGSVKKSNVESLRNKVVEGMMNVNRVVVKDVNSETSLKGGKASEKEVTESKLAKLKTLNANYLLQAHVSNIAAGQKKQEDGTTKYEGQISFTLQIMDVSTGALLASESFNYPGGMVGVAGTGVSKLTGLAGVSKFTGVSELTGMISTAANTADQAIENTMKPIVADIEKLIDDNFQLKGKILEIAKEGKGKIQEVYIDLGTKHGIQKGQKFEIYVRKTIIGRIAESSIGELQAEAVEGVDLARCKVNGGKTQEALKEALDKGDVITLKTVADKGNVLDAGKKLFGF